MTIAIRQARVDDAPAVLALYGHYSRPPDAPLSNATLRQLWPQLMAAGAVLLAEADGGTAAGSCTVSICPGLAHGGRPFAVIESAIVAPAFRRQGVGRSLMQEAQALARERGCYKATLATPSSRAGNLAFYEACGFTGDKVAFQVRFD